MRTLLKAAFALAAFAALAPAADKPNFSGDWTVDTDKSNFGPMPAPASQTRKVDHNDPTMKVTETTTGGPQGDQTFSMTYSTDGKETTNDMMGAPAKSTATWDGNALLIKMSLNAGGADILINDKWTLSDDSKTLTVVRHVVIPQGEFDFTYVMAKK